MNRFCAVVVCVFLIAGLVPESDAKSKTMKKRSTAVNPMVTSVCTDLQADFPTIPQLSGPVNSIATACFASSFSLCAMFNGIGALTNAATNYYTQYSSNKNVQAFINFITSVENLACDAANSPGSIRAAAKNVVCYAAAIANVPCVITSSINSTINQLISAANSHASASTLYTEVITVASTSTTYAFDTAGVAGCALMNYINLWYNYVSTLLSYCYTGNYGASGILIADYIYDTVIASYDISVYLPLPQ